MATTGVPVHDAVTTGYTKATISAYETGRPAYTTETIAALVKGVGLDRVVKEDPLVVDIAAGTGKFTRSLLANLPELVDKVPTITCVEPSELADNLEVAFGDKVKVVRAVADALPFADGSVDIMFVAQAFHWFATEATVAEFVRVLAPGAGLGLVWNIRQSSPWMDRLEAVLLRYYALDPSVPRVQTGAWRARFEGVEGLAPLAHTPYPWVHETTADGVVQMVLSISVVSRQPEDEKERVAAEVRALLEELPEDMKLPGGGIAFPYVANVYLTKRL